MQRLCDKYCRRQLTMEKTLDFLTIGTKKIPVSVELLEQANLKFYPENPRVYSALNSDGSAPSQEDIEEHMKKLDHVRDLRDDIEHNGGLIEAIYVRAGDWVVLEGNRRLAAYRLLCEKDPVKWGKIKCNVLPSDISDDLSFKLIGAFHIKGKKPWDAYEQASYLYRRSKETKTPIETIADELNIKPIEAKRMVAAVTLMCEHSESDNHKYSYYYEYVKDANIKKYREGSNLDNVVIGQIKRGEIARAEDIRQLGQIAKVGDKQAKKLISKIIEGSKTIYAAYDEMNETGKFDASIAKLKSFKEYVNGDTFEKNILGSSETYKKACFEMSRIVKRLTKIMEENDKKDG